MKSSGVRSFLLLAAFASFTGAPVGAAADDVFYRIGNGWVVRTNAMTGVFETLRESALPESAVVLDGNTVESTAPGGATAVAEGPPSTARSIELVTERGVVSGGGISVAVRRHERVVLENGAVQTRAAGSVFTELASGLFHRDVAGNWAPSVAEPEEIRDANGRVSAIEYGPVGGASTIRTTARTNSRGRRARQGCTTRRPMRTMQPEIRCAAWNWA